MILVVDDKPENIFSLKSLLSLHNFSVDTAESGEQALKKILNQTYSLIIMDVQMPGMDGFEVAETISGFSKAKDIPIIFLSAVNKEKKYIMKGYVSGGMDYVTKPVDPDILLMKVKTLYRLSEQNRELNKIHQSLKNEIEIRKQAEHELEKRMKELRSVMESLPLVAFTLNTKGQLEYVNEHWYEYSNALGTFPEAHADDQEVYHQWQSAFEKGQDFLSELRIHHLKEQQFRYHTIRIIPVKQDTEIIKWIGTFTDIHPQKIINNLLEEKVNERTLDLRTKNEELEVSNHELQQFTWVVSHDLKEPLRKIQTFNNIIKDRYLKDNTDALVYIDKSINSSERMGTLINDLLDYSRLSVSSLFQPTDLNGVLDEILSDFEYIITEKKAVIHKTHLPIIEAVPSQMRQIFQNLISNALKFSKRDENPVITIHSEYVEALDFDSPVSEKSTYCRIVVSDNGIGFDEKHLDKLFIIFQRLHAQSGYEGTGIGLAIAKKIVDKHNGMITARSIESKGTSFVLVIPTKQIN